MPANCDYDYIIFENDEYRLLSFTASTAEDSSDGLAQRWTRGGTLDGNYGGGSVTNGRFIPRLYGNYGGNGYSLLHTSPVSLPHFFLNGGETFHLCVISISAHH